MMTDLNIVDYFVFKNLQPYYNGDTSENSKIDRIIIRKYDVENFYSYDGNYYILDTVLLTKQGFNSISFIATYDQLILYLTDLLYSYSFKIKYG